MHMLVRQLGPPSLLQSTVKSALFTSLDQVFSEDSSPNSIGMHLNQIASLPGAPLANPPFIVHLSGVNRSVRVLCCCNQHSCDLAPLRPFRMILVFLTI